MNDHLTPMEARALLGLQSVGREIDAKHAREHAWLSNEYADTLVEIAIAHGMAPDAFSTAYGVDLETLRIVEMPNGITPPYGPEIAPNGMVHEPLSKVR